MPGIKIVVATDEAKRNLSELHKGFRELGAGTKLTENEIKSFESAVNKTTASNVYKNNLAGIQKATSMTRAETALFQARLGDYKGAWSTFISGADRANKSMGAFGSTIKNIGATLGITVGIAAVTSEIRKSIDAFSRYNKALTDMGKVTDESFGKVSSDIKSIAPALGSESQLLQGYYQILSSGIKDTAKALDLLKVASAGANAAHVEQKVMIDALTPLVKGYAGEIKSWSDSLDILFKIEELGRGTVGELANEVGSLGTISANASVSVEDFIANFSQLTLTSANVAEAATKYQAVIRSLMTPQKELKEIFAQMGVESGRAAIQMYGLAGTVVRVIDTSKELGYTTEEAFGRAEAALGAQGIKAGFNDIIGLLEEAKNRTGTAASAIAEYGESWDYAMKTFHNTIENVRKDMGEALAPALREVTQEMVAFFNNSENREGIVELFREMAAAIQAVLNVMLELHAASKAFDESWLGKIIDFPKKAIENLEKTSPFNKGKWSGFGKNEPGAPLQTMPSHESNIQKQSFMGPGEFYSPENIRKISIAIRENTDYVTKNKEAFFGLGSSVKNTSDDFKFYEVPASKAETVTKKQVKTNTESAKSFSKLSKDTKEAAKEQQAAFEKMSQDIRLVGLDGASREIAQFTIEAKELEKVVGKKAADNWLSKMSQDIVDKQIAEEIKKVAEEVESAMDKINKDFAFIGLEGTSKEMKQLTIDAEELAEVVGSDVANSWLSKMTQELVDNKLSEEAKTLAEEMKKTKEAMEFETATIGMNEFDKRIIEAAKHTSELQDKFGNQEWIDNWLTATIQAIDVDKMKALNAEVEAGLQLKLKEVEVLEKQNKISKGEALEEKINIYQQIIEKQKEHLKMLNKLGDTTGWIAQEQAILSNIEALNTLNEELREATGTFGEGFKDGFADYLKETKSAFQHGQDLAKEAAQGMNQAFSDFFFDAMQGNLKSLSDYFNSFVSSLQRSVANSLADVASQILVSGISGQKSNLTNSILGNVVGGKVSGFLNFGIGKSTIGGMLGKGFLAGGLYQGIGGMLGLPTSKYSGITAGVGAGLGSAIMPGIGTFVGGLLGGVLGGIFGGGPKRSYLGGLTKVTKDPVNLFNTKLSENYARRVDAETAKKSEEAMKQVVDSSLDAFRQIYDQLGEAQKNMIYSQLADFDINIYARGAGDRASERFEEALKLVPAQIFENLFPKFKIGLDAFVQDILSKTADFSGMLEPTSALGQIRTGLSAGFQGTTIEEMQGFVAGAKEYEQAMAQVAEIWKEITIVLNNGEGALTQYDQALQAVNAQFDEYKNVLTALGFNAEALGKVEQARAKAIERTQQEFAKKREDIFSQMNSAAGIGGNSYQREIASANKQFEDWIAQLKDLGGSVTDVQRAQGLWQQSIRFITEEFRKQRQALFVEMGDLRDSFLGKTTYETTFKSVGRQFEDWIIQLRDLGASSAEVAKANKLWGETNNAIVANFKKQRGEVMRDVYALIDDFRRTRYSKDRTALSRQFDEWKEALRNLGAGYNELNNLEKQRVKAIGRLNEQYIKEGQKLKTEIADYSNSLKGTSTTYQDEVKQLNDQFKEWAEQVKDLGGYGITSKDLTNLQNQAKRNLQESFKNRKGDVFEEVGNFIKTIADRTPEISAIIRDVNDQFKNFRDTLKDLGATTKELNALELQNITARRKALMEPFRDMLQQLQDDVQGNTRSLWGRDEWKSEFEDLSTQVQSWIDQGWINDTETFYNTAIDLFRKQYEAATELTALEQEQMNSNEEIAQNTEALKNALVGVDDMINRLVGGDLAPVQSLEFFSNQYKKSFNAVDLKKGGEGIEGFLNSIPDLLNFASGAGDYEGIRSGVLSNLYGLKGRINTEIENNPVPEQKITNEYLNKIYEQLVRFSTDARVYSERKYYWGGQSMGMGTSRAESVAQFSDYFKGYFHEGGLTKGPSIAGEKGKEWITPTYEPQRSKFLQNVGADPETLGAAIAKNIAPMLNGEKVIILNIDGKQIGRFTVKQMTTDPDLIRATRKAVGG